MTVSTRVLSLRVLAIALLVLGAGCTLELPGGHDLSNDTFVVEPHEPGEKALGQAAGSLTVYLNLDGGALNCSGEDSRTNSSYVICNVSYPAFNPAGFSCGSLAGCKEAFRIGSQELFGPWNITFVTERPASGNYEMVMVGGSAGGGAAGVAPLDCGNFNPNNISFAFSDVVAFGGCSVESVITTIGQELAHALGLCHNGDAGSVMYPAIASCAPDWGCAGQIDQCGCEGFPYDPFCPSSYFDELLGPAVDSSPPTVSFVGPTDGAAVAQTFEVTVTASDDRGVTDVYLYVNGVLEGTDNAVPYTWVIEATDTGPLELQAWAWDGWDNSAMSLIVVDVVDPSDLGQVGEICSSSGQCASGICATSGTEGRCTEYCTSPADCPASFTCEAAGAMNVCWPPEGYEPPRPGCGCVVAGGDETTPPAGGAALVTLVAAMVVALGRLRRRRS